MALHHASKRPGSTFAIYFITPKQWQAHDEAACKVAFWIENLLLLAEDLESLGIPLRVVRCDDYSKIPSQLVKFASETDSSAIFFNAEYEVNERRRDQAVEEAAAKKSLAIHAFDDRILVPADRVKTKTGGFYSVFTPYRRSWEPVVNGLIEVLPRPRKQKRPEGTESSQVPDRVPGFDLSTYRKDLWPAGESEAQKRIKNFTNAIAAYGTARDIPSENGTSLLSPYLAAGVISPRQCLSAAITANRGKIGGDNGAAVWISELCWRDFYHQVMVHCPRVCMHRPFKLATDGINWSHDQGLFDAWKEGRTGFPLVDAGMRQLNRTGWMHNRLRMVTAMFLSKNLLIDWRWGERYFMQNLIDGDLAANNGGWQWSASTGTDAVPYFRIFNPFSQSKRFDPEGSFIKKMCPELEPVPSAALHDAKKLTAAIKQHNADYPSFVIDYSASREKVLAAFKSLG